MATQRLKRDVLALEQLSGGKLIQLRSRVNDIIRHNQTWYNNGLRGGGPTPSPSPHYDKLLDEEQTKLNNATM
jgi:hypothetical protein